jgi:hypothetical protein
MQVGSLVRMKGDPQGVFGIVMEVFDDLEKNDRCYYKVDWLDELCDPSYIDTEHLEVL